MAAGHAQRPDGVLEVVEQAEHQRHVVLALERVQARVPDVEHVEHRARLLVAEHAGHRRRIGDVLGAHVHPAHRADARAEQLHAEPALVAGEVDRLDGREVVAENVRASTRSIISQRAGWIVATSSGTFGVVLDPSGRANS